MPIEFTNPDRLVAELMRLAADPALLRRTLSAMTGDEMDAFAAGLDALNDAAERVGIERTH